MIKVFETQLMRMRMYICVRFFIGKEENYDFN